MEYVYDILEKDKCWYKDVCDKSKCGDNFCIRHYKMDSLTHMATMEGKQKYPIQLRLDSDGADKEAFVQLKLIQNDISNFVNQGKNLLIYSEKTGNGKTEWCKKLLLSWFNSIWPYTELECRGLFISLPRFINAMKDNISKHNDYFQYIDDNILKADLVVWDEINYKDYTTFEHDYLLSVISQRLAEGKSNIYTTNYNLPIIEKKLGTRLSSRIVGSSVKVEFKGKDKRNWGV
jgi:DNA replication protein DnaC